MDENTDSRVGHQWQEGGGNGHEQAVVITPEARAETAWRKYIRHTIEECETTCRTVGVDCPKAIKLKAAWNTAKQAVA